MGEGHVGIEGNEAADKLAVATANDEEQQQSKVIKPPKSYLKLMLRGKTMEDWSQSWQVATTGRFTHSLLPKPSRTFCSPNNYFTWFLTNHGPFPYYLHRIGKAPSPDCVCDTGEGNSTHYVFNCPLTTAHHLKEPAIQNFQLWITKAAENPYIISKINKSMAYVFENQQNISKTT